MSQYPDLKKIISILDVPKLMIRQDKLSYCLSLTTNQPNIANSLIEKEAMNMQVGIHDFQGKAT